MKSFNNFIIEGMYDPSIFKAIFLAGGPGSGKSFVVRQLTGGLGMKIVNQDEIYELRLQSSGLGMDFTKFTDDDFIKSQIIRDKSTDLIKMRMKTWIDGRLGIIIDGTGKDFDKIKTSSEGLRGLGYDTLMIFVNTSLEVAQKRNLERSRTLPDKLLVNSWKAVQRNKDDFQSYFGNDNFIIIDNNDFSENIFKKVSNKIKNIVQKPLHNIIAKKWIEKEKELKKISPKRKEFKEYFELNEFDSPQIYCDMDGVLADFEKGITDMIGGKFSDARWDELPNDFFLQLEPMKDAKKLWGFIGKYKPIMLTAVPRESRGIIAKYAPSNKTKWMKIHFNLDKEDMRAVGRKDKQQFAKDGRDGRPNVLIDDYISNIREFRARGGIGIHHTSADDTIKQLKKLGYK